ncbi:checkpoint protein HUS1 [Xenentodon cancila]
MKFRGKIIDVACLNHFTRVVTTISKLTKVCVLRLTPDNLFFILSSKVANGGVSMWCELSQANFFDEYQMEGVSSEDNKICLEVTPENLSRALKTVQNAKSVKVKLTKKHCPCLTIAAELPTLSSISRVVTHDVPVEVIPWRLWYELKEPNMPDFDISIYLPPLKTMKNVVDRMKNLSNFLIIEANLNGEMNLKIETDLVSITTHFKDLGNPAWGDEASQGRGPSQCRDPQTMSEARVDIRKLQQFLMGQQVNPIKAMCSKSTHSSSSSPEMSFKQEETLHVGLRLVTSWSSSGVVTTISKLTKVCVLRLTPDNLFFILSSKVANGGVSMWCELSQANFFDEYQMEGVSSEDNKICLEVTPENLSRALKTVQNAKSVKVKLTKKHCPCLTIAAELPTLSSISRVVTHDVPVEVIPWRLWYELKEPNMPDFDISIYLPPLKTMKNVVDRMKNLSNFLIIEANLNGEMNLKIETDLVSITTHFKDLGNPAWGDEASQGRGPSQCRDPQTMSEARVDIRKLQQFLMGQQVNPIKAMCNIVHQSVIHLILLHEDVSLQYFIPAVV